MEAILAISCQPLLLPLLLLALVCNSHCLLSTVAIISHLPDPL
jgi:hypothetical protein